MQETPVKKLKNKKNQITEIEQKMNEPKQNVFITEEKDKKRKRIEPKKQSPEKKKQITEIEQKKKRIKKKRNYNRRKKA